MICARCNKKVYETEKLRALDQYWHKTCFKCYNCNATIALGKEKSHDNKPYCSKCHTGKFGPSGYGFSMTLDSHKVTTNVHAPPNASGNNCQSCGKAVTGKFCSGCGTEYKPPAPKSSVNFCSSCGEKSTGGSFCSKCGNKLN